MAHLVKAVKLKKPSCIKLSDDQDSPHGREDKSERCLELMLESSFVIGSTIFVLGSIAFWPEIDLSFLTSVNPTMLGCRLFDVGSILFLTPAVVTTAEMLLRETTFRNASTIVKGSQLHVIASKSRLRQLLEEADLDFDQSLLDRVAGRSLVVTDIHVNDGQVDHVTCFVPGSGTKCLPARALFDPMKAVRKSELIEQWMYLLGSVIFTAGTLIWDPGFVSFFGGKHIDHTDWLGFADMLFLTGSFMFTFAAYLNALKIEASHTHHVLRRYAVAVATCYEFGGFCFIAGTMGFIPSRWSGCNSNMERIGTVLFIAGSALYLTGSFISFSRTIVKFAIEDDHAGKVKMVQDAFKERLWRRNVEKLNEDVKSRLKQLVQEKRLQRRGNKSKMKSWTELDDQFISGGSLDGGVIPSSALVWDDEDDEQLETEWMQTGFWNLFKSRLRLNRRAHVGDLARPLQESSGCRVH